MGFLQNFKKVAPELPFLRLQFISSPNSSKTIIICLTTARNSNYWKGGGDCSALKSSSGGKFGLNIN